ncbi:hypothetical protein LCGC14_1790320, partial [marine sediment metagenome]
VGEIIAGFPLNRTGKPAFSKIAKALGVTARTMLKWRTVGGEFYKAAFVKAINSAVKNLHENIDLNKTKRAAIIRAQGGFKAKKIIEKPFIEGPAMPALGTMDKKALELFAKKLGLKRDDKDTKGVLKIKIHDAVLAQQKEVMKVVSKETTTLPPDVGAIKLVVANIGAEQDRWIEKQELNVEGKSLADIAAIMYGKKAG